MAWTDQIDLYCERTDFSLWSEPLNAVTNLAFLAAAALLWRAQSASRPPPGLKTRMLAALIAAIGVASLLFHTLATVWAGLADTLSILAFATYFVFVFLVRAARVRIAPAAAAAAVFAALSYAFPKLLPPGSANGSAGYLPYVAVLIAMIVYLRRARPASARAFLGATLLFLASLALRTADLALCAAFPPGSHFVWHLLNAWVLYLLARELSLRISRR